MAPNRLKCTHRLIPLPGISQTRPIGCRVGRYPGTCAGVSQAVAPSRPSQRAEAGPVQHQTPPEAGGSLRGSGELPAGLRRLQDRAADRLLHTGGTRWCQQVMPNAPWREGSGAERLGQRLLAALLRVCSHARSKPRPERFNGTSEAPALCAKGRLGHASCVLTPLAPFPSCRYIVEGWECFPWNFLLSLVPVLKE